MEGLGPSEEALRATPPTLKPSKKNKTTATKEQKGGFRAK